jgi:hypothetical protein
MRQGSSWLLGCGGRFHLLALAQGGKLVGDPLPLRLGERAGIARRRHVVHGRIRRRRRRPGGVSAGSAKSASCDVQPVLATATSASAGASRRRREKARRDRPNPIITT